MVAPAPIPSRKAMQVTLSLQFDDNLMHRLPFLLLLLVLFIASSILFARVNFITADAFDVSRAEFVIAKFYSLTFVLFAIIFSLGLALAAFYGAALEPFQALLTAPATLLPALVLGLLFPHHVIAFVAFALVLTLCAVLSSLKRSLSIDDAGKAMNRALIVLVLLAVLFAYTNVDSHKEAYFDQFISSIAGLVPGLGGGGEGATLAATQSIAALCAGAISSINVTIPPDAFAVDRQAIYSAMVQANSTFGTAPPGDLREIPLSACSGAIPIALSASLPRVSQALSQQLQSGPQLLPTPSPNNATNASTREPQPTNATAFLRSQALGLPPLKAMYDYMAVFMALAVLVSSALFAWIARLLGVGFYWLLLKI